MSLFGLFGGADINSSVEEFRKTPHAYLIDVRTEGEYATGHIEGSLNIPLDKMASINAYHIDLQAPLFVHCQSGARSGQAVSYLKSIGYVNAQNIGGIAGYKGAVVR